MDYTTTPRTEFLTDSTEILVQSISTDFTWQQYARLQDDLESLLRSLFLETEDILQLSDYALMLADSGLDEFAHALKDINSDLNAFKTQADYIVSQAIPMTGSEYTRLITEAFRDSGVQDRVTSFGREPITLSEPNINVLSCPTRPALEVDPTLQVLRLRKEGTFTAFSGLPGQSRSRSIGGELYIDKIYGTPVERIGAMGQDSKAWTLSAASRMPLGRGFSYLDSPLVPWIPDTYQGGIAVRLRADLQNPAPITELRLRGSLLPGGVQTRLLETAAVVSSRPDPLNLTSHPTRALNQGWAGPPVLSNVGWALTPGSTSRWTTAPDRPAYLYSNGSLADYALILAGQAYTSLSARPNSHYALRYRAFCPYHYPGAVVSAPSGVYPAPPSATFVSVYYYASASPTFGIDTPLHIDTFRDEYPLQGNGYGGAGTYVHLVKTPKTCQTLILAVGTDPIYQQGINNSQNNAEVAYSDVWICDEVLTRTWSKELPTAMDSNLQGPQIPGGVGSFSNEEAVESLVVSLGNLSGGFILTDVWVTLGQASPSIERADTWDSLSNHVVESPILPPYALSLPVDIPSKRVSHDPLILHQARYVGVGQAEWDASKYRLVGQLLQTARQWPSIFSRLGLWTSTFSRGGRRDPLPIPFKGAAGRYWKLVPGITSQKTAITSMMSQVSAMWPNLWQTILQLSKARRQALSRPILLLSSLTEAKAQAVDASSLYVYSLGLSSFSLIREEYATSGLYITEQMQNIDGKNSVAGEIRELGIITDPPLPTFGGRLRLWIVPDSQVLDGTGQDSPSSLLSRAIPLDSQNPRATFHSTAESLSGVSPAQSDIMNAWMHLGGGGSQPAFSVSPSIATDIMRGGIDPDYVQTGIRLSHLPYINREAIYRVSAAISSGSTTKPKAYDPNAVGPIVELALAASGGTGLNSISGYQPIRVTLDLPNGRQILPDVLGRPRPGEVIYSGREILQQASDTQMSYLPADPAVYAHKTADNPALSMQQQQVFKKSFVTAYSPIAAGINGAAIKLYWHKSADFDPASGGILIRSNVLLANSDYEVNVNTGQIRIIGTPPSSWQEYDQIVAEYYWRVGDISPKEFFPPADLLSLYTPYVPYIVGGAAGTAGPPLYVPLQSILQGYLDTPTLLSDPSFTQQGTRWTTTNDVDWNGAGRDNNNYSSHITGPYNYFFGDSDGEGVSQTIVYPGPGASNLSVWFNYDPDDGHAPVDARTTITLSVLRDGSSTPLEQYSFVADPPYRGTQNLPCMKGSDTNSSQLGVTPPWWFPFDVNAANPYMSAWSYFRSTLTPNESSQTVYQWPSMHMSANSHGDYVIPTDTTTGFAAPADSVDNTTTFGCVRSSHYEYPWGCAIPLTTPKATPGSTPLRLKVSVNRRGGSNAGLGCIVSRIDLWFKNPNYVMGCQSPYAYDAATNSCKYQLAPTGTVTGPGSSTLLGDIFLVPTQQTYPVTRNITNYATDSSQTLRRANMDPLSPDYYPIFEYRIDPGGVLKFADDLSSIGSYAGTDVEVRYDYLDISPRVIVEVLPEGQSAFDLPSSTAMTPTRPAVETPVLNSLHILLNTRQ